MQCIDLASVISIGAAMQVIDRLSIGGALLTWW